MNFRSIYRIIKLHEVKLLNIFTHHTTSKQQDVNKCQK